MMMTPLKAAHMGLSITIAFIFTFCQIQIVTSTLILAFNLLFFFALFMAYGIIAYVMFHSSPGYEDPRQSTTQIGVQNIYEYQTNEQRRQTILNQLKVRGLADVYLLQLQEQLIFLYARTSFCPQCKYIKKPRSHHCYTCGKCVIRKQFHSRLIGICIGERNLKIYFQYFLIVLLLNTYIAFTSLLNGILFFDQIQSWSWFRILFYIILMIFCTLVALVILFNVYKLISRLRKNITAQQQKIGSFVKKNPFSQQDFYSKLFPNWESFIETNYKNQQFELEMASSERIPVTNI